MTERRKKDKKKKGQEVTSTNGQKGVSISSVENGTERCTKVTFAADLHTIPGPSNHNDLHRRASLLESPGCCVDKLNRTLIPPFNSGREESWNKGKNPAVTPDLHKPRPGPSHTSTTTPPTRTEYSGRTDLYSTEREEELSAAESAADGSTRTWTWTVPPQRSAHQHHHASYKI
ncbi:hypothetical protein MHYP_G00257110 [Metynnis hypsauchen]